MARRQDTSFTVEGDRVVGHLHLPDGSSGPHPAVVVGGPMTSVKEQVTGVYAAALADRGYAALSIDHRHYGQSEGQPRQYENFHHKIADLRAALDHLAGRPEVDGERLGAVGVCLGTGYIVWAAIGHDRVKAVGGVAGYYRDVTAMRAADPEGFNAKVEQGIAARRHYEATGETLMIPAAATTGDAAMTLPDTFDYYATARAGVPNYTNAFAVMSREHFLPFDVQPAARQLTVPMLMVHAEKALSPAWARKFYDTLEVSKAIHWLESANQVDFYDRPHLVEPAADLLAGHLGRCL
ncbi:MAG: alpha/beta fold hydrolase [Alphaproteobacteria bacterium]|jgi:dienelactone hydrolase|nr:alpha/beta fold hydrolase [Alphaproteobacteria bacterium]